ncbi:discoidin domain-containing protein [Paenibacillus tarimensis]|nr:hypothetical protein [Paenibacillus tarimensis]
MKFRRYLSAFLVLAILSTLLVGMGSTTTVSAAAPSTGKITLTADNEFTLYHNGNLIGEGTSWYSAYTFDLPITEGKNVIAVKAKDLGSYAGLIADISYLGDNIVTDFNWKASGTYTAGWEKSDFNDASWSRAVEYGKYGASPWTNQVSGMPADTSARWIWAGSTNQNTPHPEAYFRLVFNATTEGVGVANPAESVGQFANVEYQLKSNIPMPASIKNKLSIAPNTIENEAESGTFQLTASEYQQLQANLKVGTIYLDSATTKAIKITNVTTGSTVTTVSWTAPEVNELFEYYDIPEQAVTFDEQNLIIPTNSAAARASVMEALELPEAEMEPSPAAELPAETDIRNTDAPVQVESAEPNAAATEAAEAVEAAEATTADEVVIDQQPAADETSAPEAEQPQDTIEPAVNEEAEMMEASAIAAAADDFTRCAKTGRDFKCEFKKVLINEQGTNGKIYVETGGHITLLTPKISGTYNIKKYDLKFTAGEKANVYIKGEAKFKKDIKVPIFGFEVDAGGLGKASVGVYLVIGVDGSVTFEFRVDQGFTVEAGVRGKNFLFVPTSITPYSHVDRYLTTTYSIEGEIKAYAGAQAEALLYIAKKKVLEVKVFAGIEGEGKWTAGTNVPTQIKLSIDAVVRGDAAALGKSVQLFRIAWPLVRVEKGPTDPGQNPNPGQPSVNLAIGAAVSADTTFPGYAAAKINDGDRNTTVGGNYSWANNNGAPLPQHVYMNFGSNRTFNKIDLYTSQGYVMADYDLQYWNGSSWVTLVSVTGNTSTHRSHTFGEVTSSQIRVVCRKGPANQTNYVRINELEVYLDQTSTNKAIGAAVSADSTFPGYSVNRINDGNRSTTLGGDYSWANNNGASLPQHVYMNFGSNKTFSKIDLYTSQGYVLADYDLQYWNGSSWVTLVSITGNTSTYRSHSFNSITASQVRVVCRKGPAHQTNYVRINELEVY